MNFQLAHISDIHFFETTYTPLQFFNRRFLANFNYLLTRKKKFRQSQVFDLAEKLLAEGISSLLITGDFTCSASHQEFEKSVELIAHLKQLGFTIYAFPGNHDVYTKKAHREKRFYQKLKDLIDFYGDFSLNLIDHHVAGYFLTEKTYLVLIDTTTFNRGRRANGHFDQLRETHLKALLKEIPDDCSIILSTHFPYEAYKVPKAHLIGGDRLKRIIDEDPRVKLYLHGHRHIPDIQKRTSHLIVDSGSISIKALSPFSLIECSPLSITAKIFTKPNQLYVEEVIKR